MARDGEVVSSSTSVMFTVKFHVRPIRWAVVATEASPLSVALMLFLAWLSRAGEFAMLG